MSFKSKEILLEEIQQLFTQLNQGTFDAEKMELLVANSRELYERVIILRHRADELFVKDEPIEYLEDLVEETEETEDDLVQMEDGSVMEEVIIEELDEPSIENSEETEIHTQDEEVEEVAIDKNTAENTVFSVSEKGSDFSFDLFTEDDSAPEVILPPVEKETAISSFVAPQESVSDNRVVDNLISDSEEKSVPTFTESNEVSPDVPSNSFSASQQMDSDSSPVSSNHSNLSFFSGYESIKANPRAMMVSPKIEQLATCFSLNEKLFYIRELFNGSSNDFNQLIHSIDQLSDFEQAKIQINPIAEQNRWNLSSQPTLDFINKVERRFF